MKIDRKGIERIIVLQQDQSDCGVACLLTLIRYYGGNVSLERLRELSGTSKQGTSLLGLYQAAQSAGFAAEGCEADIPSLIAHGKPVILHLLVEERLEHYVVCFGYEEECFIIGDPSKGLCFYTREELESCWKSHACLTLSPDEKFQKVTDASIEKRKWILHLIHKDFGILGISLLIGVVIAVLGMTTAIFSQKLIDDIIPNKDYRMLWIGAGLVSVLLLARLGLSALRQYLLYIQSKNFNNRIIAFFYGKLLRLPKLFFDTRKVGDMVARLNDTARIQSVISTVAGDVIISVLSTLATLGFLAYYSMSMAAAFLLFIPLLSYVVYRYNQPIIQAQREVMVWYAHSESNFINTMQGIDTIKSFNRQATFGKLNRTLYNAYQDRILKLGKISIHLSLFSGFLSICITLFSIVYGACLVFSEQLKLGELMAAVSLIASITPSIISLALITIPINEAKVAFNRMFEFIGLEPENERGINVTEPICSITLREVSFRFAGSRQILHQISAEFIAGELSFILGESGRGKTTLCHLLEKFYIPEDGRILINHGIDLGEIAVGDWRKHIGIISQEVYIFNGTVLDNLCLGLPPRDAQTAISRCSEYGLDKYIELLPQGYATVVGENGINLSGGQKQLIALARLLIKMPPIMILDEPTSAMDKDLERFSMQILLRLKPGRIIIVVSHRLHLVERYADRVVRLES